MYYVIQQSWYYSTVMLSLLLMQFVGYQFSSEYPKNQLFLYLSVA